MAFRWSDKQLEFLSTYVGYYNHRELSKRLGRSVTAVKLKQHRMGLRFFDNIYTLSLLGRELGRSKTIIRKWWHRGWLRGRRATWKACYGKTPVLFREEDVVEFLRTHHELFDYRKVSNRYFANVISEVSR